MKQSIKAALVSALVFPGLGQIMVLKKLARGCIFLAPSLAGAVYILRTVLVQADALAGQISSGALPLDPQLIAAQLSANPAASGPVMTAATLAVVLCWCASIIDAILFGGNGAGHRH
ncbi:MAG: hypothetical protein V4724_33065 [Pseudomonadota bacterium]